MGAEFRLYWQIVLNAIKSNTAYKASLFCSLLFRVIAVFASLSIWRALFHNNKMVTSSAGNISLNEMGTYMILSSLISIVVSSDVIRRLHEKITSGEIAMDLLKPLSVKGVFLCTTLADNGVKTLFQGGPFFLMCWWLFPQHSPQWTHLLGFAVVLVNAFVINFLLSYVVGLLGFWYLTVNHLDFFLRCLVNLFSGAMAPLWFFPDSLRRLADILPFKLIYFAPINIYLGKLSWAAVGQVIGLQLVWILIMLGVERWVWRQGTVKLVIQGG